MLTIWSSFSPYISYLVSFLALFLLIEQIIYMKKKKFLPGPTFVLPFIGNAISMVLNPTKFWNFQSSMAKTTPLGISANYIIGKFILYIYSTELSHKIFSNVRPDGFHLIGHPFGKKLFGEHNLIYMFGQEHKDLRRRIAPNFTPKALATYTKIQQDIILKHLKYWLQKSTENNSSEPIPLRILCRDMNLDTSQAVFVGPYLGGESRERFNKDYNFFNVGLMKLPVDFPGFAFRNARVAVKRLVDTLSVCAEESEAKMALGEEPTCLIDFWMHDTLREVKEAQENGDKLPFRYTHEEIGGHLFDFLFAAQDASTSSLLWSITLLDSHPQVLEKVRKEVGTIWSPESNTPIKAEQLMQMKYVAAVAREVVRYRAPATMVPHIAGVDFQLTEEYVVPKGTIVFPSIFDSSFQGFIEPDRFDPDRFMEDRQEEKVYKRNFLAFGAGAHQCVGQRYALNHLILFIAMFVSLVDFKRGRSNGCDEIAYVPTIVPKDDCKVFLSQRCNKYPCFSLESEKESHTAIPIKSPIFRSDHL